MKIACEVIRDLLVLYEDESCSKQSRALVREHLEECEACTDYLQRLRHETELVAFAAAAEPDAESRALKHSFRKIRRRWAVSVLAVLMLFPAAGIGLLGYHEYKEQGIAFSNLDDIYRCVRFFRYIEQKDFEAAAEFLNYPDIEYQQYAMEKNLTREQFADDMRRKAVRRMQEYDALGISINRVSYHDAYLVNGRWNVDVSFAENYPDGSSQKAVVSIYGDFQYTGLRMLSDEAGSILYIQNILQGYVEEDPMGYRDYEAGFEILDGQKAVLTWKGGKRNLKGSGQIMLVNTSYGAANINDISKKRLMQGSQIQIPVPGKYALVSADGDDVVDLTDFVDINISDIQ